TTDQYSAYGQWPITKHVSVMGRWGYDALASKTLNTMAAVEYDQDCWVIRMAYSQVLTNAATNTQILFQLEFKGFGGIGNNPVDIMKLNIPGYKPAPQALPPSSFENYK
ncbi:MAG: LPS-assembly protein LptD, partial [Burkholderiaceae bacterium]|nr:LPS-assembly protein LptD [Burkholderiaceae bacterium]